ncbi:aryl-alcohol-oxidase from pleurotus Eryingii, partial [Mycena capillaripes]
MWTTLFTAITLGSALCRAAIYENVVELENLNIQFDFIVVGAGTAGAVVANRLCENPNHSVLLLEAGGSRDSQYTARLELHNYAASWVEQSHDYMVYTRGSKEDFDRFARVADDERWSWNSLVPYMKSFNGINSVTLSGLPSPIDSMVIETTRELDEFPFNLDMNSREPLGISWDQMTVKDGARSSSATSYLAPRFISRPNLQVLLHARVTRVLPTASNDFRTVEFVQDLQVAGKRLTLTAKKEIVLSAGSVGSPTILMYSGIGNSARLQKLGIEPLHNLPSVGQNLTDHSLLPLGWFVNSTDTFDTEIRNATLAAEEFEQWNTTRTGRLVNNPATHIGWFRVPDNSSIFERFPDPAAGPATPHYEFLISNGILGPPPPTGNYLWITLIVTSPASRGSIVLNTSDPLAPPLINPNLLSSEVDLFFMRYAIRSALRFAAAKPWAGYAIAPPVGVNSTSTDHEIDEYIRENAGTVFHPVGTASMSSLGAKYGVVNPDLKVKGLTGLRVIDLSVMMCCADNTKPLIPAAHTQAAAYIIGERGADMIKETWH